jgi:heptosyltransferase-1
LASLFYDFSYNVDQNNIAVVRLRSLVAKIFNLDVDLNKIDFEAKTQACNINFANGYVILLHGTSRIDKQWSFDNWLTLAQWLVANSSQQIVITYSNDSEYSFCQQLFNELKSDRITIVDKLPFAQLSDLIFNSQLVVGVDTGFTHYANLVNRPTIGIYLDSIPRYGGIMESSIAKNFGGKKQQVNPQQIIEYIKDKNFLE